MRAPRRGERLAPVTSEISPLTRHPRTRKSGSARVVLLGTSAKFRAWVSGQAEISQRRQPPFLAIVLRPSGSAPFKCQVAPCSPHAHPRAARRGARVTRVGVGAGCAISRVRGRVRYCRRRPDGGERRPRRAIGAAPNGTLHLALGKNDFWGFPDIVLWPRPSSTTRRAWCMSRSSATRSSTRASPPRSASPDARLSAAVRGRRLALRLDDVVVAARDGGGASRSRA